MHNGLCNQCAENAAPNLITLRPMSDPGPFPSGPWRGFYVYSADGARHGMAMRLTFKDGVLTGAGDDDIGHFTIKGRYDAESLEVHWIKTYVGRHSVYYKGFGEPARIWGTWELASWSGGFKIWPGGGDLSLVESAEAEVEVPDAVPASALKADR